MISKNERQITEYYERGGTRPVAILTSKEPSNVFFLYERVGDDYVKLGKGNSPLELEERYDIRSRMGMTDDE